jgi:hypothetical protein
LMSVILFLVAYFTNAALIFLGPLSQRSATGFPLGSILYSKDLITGPGTEKSTSIPRASR